MVIVTWHCVVTVGIYIYIRSLVSLVFPGLTCRIYAGSSSLFGCYLLFVQITTEQTVTGDPHTTAARRHTRAAHPG